MQTTRSHAWLSDLQLFGFQLFLLQLALSCLHLSQLSSKCLLTRCQLCFTLQDLSVAGQGGSLLLAQVSFPLGNCSFTHFHICSCLLNLQSQSREGSSSGWNAGYHKAGDWQAMDDASTNQMFQLMRSMAA